MYSSLISPPSRKIMGRSGVTRTLSRACCESSLMLLILVAATTMTASCGDRVGSGDGGGDVYPDSDRDGGCDADSVTDECTEQGTLCLDDTIVRCDEVGQIPQQVTDCSVRPFTGCREDLCRSFGEEPVPCCFSDEDFCFGQVDLAEEERLVIASAAGVGQGYLCSAYPLDGTDFVFRVDSLFDGCEEGFFRLIVRGELPRDLFGQPQPLCVDGRSQASLDMSVAEPDPDHPGEYLVVDYTGGDCAFSDGTLTLHRWEAEGDRRFRITADVRLFSFETGAFRELLLAADGRLTLYE